MKTIIANLVVEHSHSDPSASYGLYDNAAFAKIEQELAEDGWLSGTIEPMMVDKTRAQFSKVSDLVKFCEIFNIVINQETNCWLED